MKYLACLVLSPLLLAGCQTFAPLAKNESAIAAVAEPEQPRTIVFDETTGLGALDESNLRKGSCGMVLWTLDERRPSPVFRYEADGFAELKIGDALFSLTRVEATGVSAFGITEEQVFVITDELDDKPAISVSAKLGMGFDGGIYLERGLIKVQSPEGWSIVAPVAGLAGCRSK